MGSTWESLDGSPIKQSLSTIPEAPEGEIPESELLAPGPEIVEKNALKPPLFNTDIQREIIISTPCGGAEDPPLLSTTQVTVVSDIPEIQVFPTAPAKINEARERSGNGEEENSGLLQGFDDAGILHIPSFDEALALWTQLEPQLKDREIGDMLAEHLGMDDTQPNPAQASQLEAWLRHFVSIHHIKNTISKLQKDIGTREGRIKGEIVQYSQVVHEERRRLRRLGWEALQDSKETSY